MKVNILEYVSFQRELGKGDQVRRLDQHHNLKNWPHCDH